jgi:HEAT repeat protein
VLASLRKFAAASSYLYDPNPDVRIFAAWLLCKQTLYSQQVVDVLIAVLSAEEESELDRYIPRAERVAPVLGAIGQAARRAIPLLIAQMPTHGYEVCKALPDIGGTEAVEALLGLLNNPNPHVRRSACGALIRLERYRDSIVPRLIQLLETEIDNGVCLAAIQALATFGGGGVAAIPTLRRVRERLSALPASPQANFMLKEADRCFAQVSGNLDMD